MLRWLMSYSHSGFSRADVRLPAATALPAAAPPAAVAPARQAQLYLDQLHTLLPSCFNPYLSQRLKIHGQIFKSKTAGKYRVTHLLAD